MQHSRFTRCLIIILLLSSVLTIGVIPDAISQQLITSTSFLTSSSLQATTYYLPTLATSTSTGIETLTTTGSFERLQNVCYFAFLPIFIARGMTHVEYSVSPSMTLNIMHYIDWYFWSTSFLTAETSGCRPTGPIPPLYYEISITGSGSVDVALPSGVKCGIVLTDTILAVTPVATLTIAPVTGTNTSTVTFSILSTSATSVTKTFAFLTTQIALTKTYANEIVAAITIMILFVGIWVMMSRRTKQSN